jgi:uncharacterized DUF497 family protein
MSGFIFEWDQEKDAINREKHGILFSFARRAFNDPRRVVARDLTHSHKEERYFCFGKVEGEVVTVRFTYREGVIRIIGAGYWRKGKAAYEKENKIHE